MAIVYLALGSNIGDSQDYLCKTQALLLPLLSAAVSAPLYVSKAVGFKDQADFLNTVVRGQTTLSPEELLAAVKLIEQKIGRIERFRWGPREIDIDIIFYDSLIMHKDNLVLPHPRLAEREFVLRPLCDLCKDFIDPQSKQMVQTLLAKLPSNMHSIITT